MIGRGLLIGTLLVAGTVAEAQRTGTRMDRNANSARSVNSRDTNSAFQVANQFGQCLARREGKSMKRVLELSYGSGEQRKAMFGVMDSFDGCLGDSEDFDQLATTGTLTAGGASEYFLKVEAKPEDIVAVKGMTDEALAASAFKPRNGAEELALCVVRSSPEGVARLGRTIPTSKAEKAAVAAVLPSVGPCVREGQKLQLNAPSLRALLSYGLYRATVAGKPQ